MTLRVPLYGLSLVAATIAAPAWADPCTAPLPSRAGQTFTGQVRYVGDGDSLCVGATADPAEWIEVRLADFNAPELQSPEGPRGKAMLAELALGRFAACRTEAGRAGRVTTWDRVIARCWVGGDTIGSRLRRAGAPEGGR